MALLGYSGLNAHFLQDADQQRLTAILGELPVGLQGEVLSALTHVAPQTISAWLKAGMLQEWIKQGRRVLTERGERGEQLAAVFVAATPTMLPVLTQAELAEWVRVGLDIEEVDGAGVFAVLPNGLAALDEAERLSCYRLVRTAVYHSVQAAAALYRTLPHTLQTLPSPLRGLLLRCLQAAAAFDPTPLPALLPLLGPTLRSLPPESRAPLLERIVQLAQVFPAGVARLFRALLRAYDEVGEEGVKTWIRTGEEIARRNPLAGEAFFALESRTSLLTLRHASPAVSLSDVQAQLLKYMHMLCGVAVGIEETDVLSFPPPLAKEYDDVLPLPGSVELFPTYEENFRLYRALAAHQAGRVEFGTHDLSLPLVWPHLSDAVRALAGPEAAPPNDLASYFQLFAEPEQIEALFLFIESQRIAARLAAAYPGLQEDLGWAESLTELLPAALTPLLSLLPSPLWPDLGREPTVYDSLLLATEVYTSHTQPRVQPPSQVPSARQSEGSGESEDAVTLVDVEGEGERREGTRLSAEQQATLQKIIAALRSRPGQKKIQRKKIPAAFFSTVDDAAEDAVEQEEPQRKKRANERRVHTTAGLRYFYDEWDYLIEDYRTQWCELREMPLSGDTGAFFSATLAAYAHLTPDIKREFQRLRPRLYRHIKGLEDGEEIDLEAAVTARVDRRTGNPPSPKLYAARQPVERDVAALFLVDMSASTDARISRTTSTELLTEREDVRVIDVMKEAVVLLVAALEDIGDVYAIYGFSSSGRRNVEVYPVKTFAESLSADVKGRISAIAPKRSTRMGTAVRHATRKLKELSCRAKLLVLVSDGFPEDADYGRDRDTPTYGLRDTMMALREAERSGILSFCLTVDKGGHDYLREMCAPSRYLVIDDIWSLPVELPKIYQRHIRSQQL